MSFMTPRAPAAPIAPAEAPSRLRGMAPGARLAVPSPGACLTGTNSGARPAVPSPGARLAGTNSSARLAGATALAALLGTLAAPPALAEVSAERVREAFEAYNERFGASVEVGSEEASDGAVALNEVTLAFVTRAMVPSGDGEDGAEEARARDVRIEVVFDEMAFEEQDDGTVRVTTAPEGRLTVRSEGAEGGANGGDGATGMLEMRLLSEGFEMIVSEAEGAAGDEGALRYDYAADRLGAEAIEATRDGEPVEVEALFALTEVSGRSVMAPEGAEGETTPWRDSLTAGGLLFEIEAPVQGEDGDGEGRLALSYRVADLAIEGSGLVPTGEAGADASGALITEGRLTGDLAIDFGAVAYSLDGAGADGAPPARVEGGGEGGRYTLAFGPERLAFEGATQGTRLTIEGGEMPLERVEMQIAETEMALALPVAEGGAAQPFTLRYGLSGLTLGDEVWASFDPEGRLPRDPAALLLGVEGRMRLLAGLFDEAGQAALADQEEAPAEVEQAALDLRLEIAGAVLDAAGDFAFDPSDTETFEGIPAPTGTLTIEAAGIDRLLDTLTDMGLVPPDQLMPARLMLGLFARPDGQGGYTSAIEVDGATGRVTANGQRLR